MFQDPRLTPLARARSARIETLVETENFVIVYQVGHRNGKRRAQALADACERDFAELKSWFKVTKGFGPSNRVTLLVDTASYARNWGYRSDGTTKVVIDTFDNTSESRTSRVCGAIKGKPTTLFAPFSWPRSSRS